MLRYCFVMSASGFEWQDYDVEDVLSVRLRGYRKKYRIAKSQETITWVLVGSVKGIYFPRQPLAAQRVQRMLSNLRVLTNPRPSNLPRSRLCRMTTFGCLETSPNQVIYFPLLWNEVDQTWAYVGYSAIRLL